jgi:lycopene epsilon-cyclase
VDSHGRGGGAARGGPRVVGFGAAGGLVHPATGYSVARSLAAAPVLAHAVAGALSAPGASPASAARQAWRALWPADARRRNALYRFGLEALVEMDAAATRDFFHAFCRLPAAQWSGFVSGSLSSAGIVKAMARLFASAEPPLRRSLVRPAFGRPGGGLAAGLIHSLLPSA